MLFYHRTVELKTLESLYKQKDGSAKMAVITGRRRVGKTVLANKFTANKPHLYLFVAKKAEKLLCDEFMDQIRLTFPSVVVGEFEHFKDIFELLLIVAKQHPFVLIIDEFQEFFNINPSIYSDMQNLWDKHKQSSKIQVLFLGSVFSLMHKIFQDAKEPLFGRADRIIQLKPFSVHDLYTILNDHHHPEISTLFNYYIYTGGMPKYVEMLLTNGVFNEQEIIDFILASGSPLLDEGKNVLIEEFGKEYGIYFSILELISCGKTSRGEIESILQKDIGGYLDRLDNDYAVIKKFKPINSKKNTKLQKYHMRDHFLRFWFRFIYSNKSAIESENFSYIKQLLARDLNTYKGKLLETFFHDIFSQSHRYNLVGSYWERDGTNEIDLVAVNDLNKTIDIAEIKLNKQNISLAYLKQKSINLLHEYANYKVTYHALSLDDAGDMLG